MSEDEKQFRIDLREHLDLEVLCLVQYGGMNIEQAYNEVFRNPPFSEDFTGKTEDIVFHEEPYYWAMSVLHKDNDPAWYHNPQLWPIPKHYRELERKYQSWRAETQQKYPLFYRVLIESIVQISRFGDKN